MSQDHKLKISKSNTGKKYTRTAPNTRPGRAWTDEEKKKASSIAKERGFGKWMQGRKLSANICAKLSKSKTGHPTTQETRNKISEKNKGKLNGMYGRGHTKEAKSRISEAARKMWLRDDIKNLCKTPEFSARMKKVREAQITPKVSSMENILSALLSELGILFTRQKYIKIPHGYKADFFLPSYGLVIECDGIYWHQYPNLREIDKIRTQEMVSSGIKVIRIWEHETLSLTSRILLDVIEGRSLKERPLPVPREYIRKLERCERIFNTVA